MRKKCSPKNQNKLGNPVKQNFNGTCYMQKSTLYIIFLQQQNVGMHGPLVDQDQFPRNDIDVYSVRHARHKIICECLCSFRVIFVQQQNMAIHGPLVDKISFHEMTRQKSFVMVYYTDLDLYILL